MLGSLPSLAPFTRPPFVPPAGGGGYAAAVMADAPLNYWRLGESSGTVAVDAMGNNSGTYNGSISLAQAGLITGDSDTCISRVQGDSGNVDCGNITAFNGAAAVTVECWAKLSGFNFQNFAALLTKGGPFAGWPFVLMCNADPRPQFFVQYNGGSPTAIAQSSVAIWDGVTHHLVGRFDGAHVSIWVDGTKTGESACTGLTDSVSFPVQIAPNFLGSGASGWSINGQIDEVALYNAALSDARILAHYLAGI